MDLDKTPAFENSIGNDTSLTKSKKKKKKDKNLDLGEKQAEATFRVEPSEKPAQVSALNTHVIMIFIEFLSGRKYPSLILSWIT